MASSSSSATKSIDVGSMFLMDLSIQESDSISEPSDDTFYRDQDNTNFVFPYYQKSLNNLSSEANQQQQLTTTDTTRRQKRQLYVNETFGNKSLESDDYLNNRDDDDYLANPLEGLAIAIRGKDEPQSEYQYNMRTNNKRFNGSNDNDRQVTTSITVAEPQLSPDLRDPLSSSSLSDESFVASSGTSLSASFIASSSGDNEDRGSTATREDSGVLDMRDLDNQLNTFDRRFEANDCKLENSNKQRLLQEKSISMTTNNKATNLNMMNRSNSNNNRSSNDSSTDKSAENHNQNDSYYAAGNSDYLINGSKPTYGNTTSSISNGKNASNSSHNNNHNHHSHHPLHHGATKPRRSMSASLPIQVPARQMKKDLNKMKLVMNRNLAAGELSADGSVVEKVDEAVAQRIITKTTTSNSRNKVATQPSQVGVLDEVDEFLDQEYNENHQNHYPMDEFDDEHLRAEENPMKLFASIQALAKSLHEDAELFGSLPPKRLLESPIRSLALA